MAPRLATMPNPRPLTVPAKQENSTNGGAMSEFQSLHQELLEVGAEYAPEYEYNGAQVPALYALTFEQIEQFLEKHHVSATSERVAAAPQAVEPIHKTAQAVLNHWNSP